MSSALTLAVGSAALALVISPGSMLLVAMTLFSASLIVRHRLHEDPAVPDFTYIAPALAVAVGITVTLRAVPFGMKNALNESALLVDIGQWMPLGAITILAVYCLAGVDTTKPPYDIPEVTGVTITVAIHWWRRNAVLSIVTDTAACLVLTNWVVPI
jgi:branched-subunit amino acid transport protein AzlD